MANGISDARLLPWSASALSVSGETSSERAVLPMKSKRQNLNPAAKPTKEPKLSRTHAPADLSPADWQRGLRRQFGREQAFGLENLGSEPFFSEFRVSNPVSKSSYRVAIRGLGPGGNFCSCPDYATSELGTCGSIRYNRSSPLLIAFWASRFKYRPVRATFAKGRSRSGFSNSKEVALSNPALHVAEQLARRAAPCTADVRGVSVGWSLRRRGQSIRLCGGAPRDSNAPGLAPAGSSRR